MMSISSTITILGVAANKDFHNKYQRLECFENLKKNYFRSFNCCLAAVLVQVFGPGVDFILSQQEEQQENFANF